MSDEQVEVAALTLTPKQIHVLLEGGTDAPDEPQLASTSRSMVSAGTSREEGIFVCAVGGLPLFLSEDLIQPSDGAGRGGWPGFRRPVHPEHVILREEAGPLRRTEVLCARSGCHLGHLFDDGPAPTCQRFCINRSSLVFVPITEPLPAELRPIHRPSVSAVGSLGTFGRALERIGVEASTFAGGCFWHVRDDFRTVPGVHNATCGYVDGIEAVRVLFDPLVITYERLARRFFDMHDPTTGDRQGNDWGPQYQAAIFPHDEDQRRAADEVIAWAGMQLQRAISDEQSHDGTSPPHVAEIAKVNEQPRADTNQGRIASDSAGEMDSTWGGGTYPRQGDSSMETPVSVAWWESQAIRTRVIPSRVDDFVPDSTGGDHPKIDTAAGTR